MEGVRSDSWEGNWEMSLYYESSSVTCAAVTQSLGTAQALYPSKISYCIRSNATRHSEVDFHANTLSTIAAFSEHIEWNAFIYATYAHKEKTKQIEADLSCPRL